MVLYGTYPLRVEARRERRNPHCGRLYEKVAIRQLQAPSSKLQAPSSKLQAPNQDAGTSRPVKPLERFYLKLEA